MSAQQHRMSGYSPGLRARRTALGIPDATMATGLVLSLGEVLSVETAAMVGGHQTEKAEYYVYWLDRLERLTQEQRDIQIAHAREGRRFR
jgi:hypothetical protein